jgi:hypothetical protein
MFAAFNFIAFGHIGLDPVSHLKKMKDDVLPGSAKGG